MISPKGKDLEACSQMDEKAVESLHRRMNKLLEEQGKPTVWLTRRVASDVAIDVAVYGSGFVLFTE